jgi:hypothetical protein
MPMDYAKVTMKPYNLFARSLVLDVPAPRPACPEHTEREPAPFWKAGNGLVVRKLDGVVRDPDVRDKWPFLRPGTRRQLPVRVSHARRNDGTAHLISELPPTLCHWTTHRLREHRLPRAGE